MNKANIISALSILLPIICGSITYRHQSFLFRILFVFFIFSGLVELTGDYLSFHKLSNIVLLNLFGLIESIIYVALLLPVIINKRKKIYTIGSIILLLLVFIASSIYSGSFVQYNSIYLIAECIALIIIAAALLIKTASEPNLRLNKNGLFWIGAGLFIYFSLSLGVFVIEDIEIKNNSNSLNSLWVIHSTVNVTANILYSIAFLCQIPQHKL